MYKRYFSLEQDIYRLLWRSKVCLERKNQITILISSGCFKYKIYNKRYLKEYFDFLPKTTEVLVFEACAKENLKIILNKGFSKEKEKRIDEIIKIITKKEV